jgi:hypothetical protein
MKRLPMPTSCPVTGEPLEVTRLENPSSGIIIEGRFIPNEFALLSPEHLELLRLFMRTRGNLKDVERHLGVSYPTVRLRMEGLFKALGYDDQPEVKTARSEVLEMLEKGEITPTEAKSRLQSMKRGS